MVGLWTTSPAAPVIHTRGGSGLVRPRTDAHCTGANRRHRAPRPARPRPGHRRARAYGVRRRRRRARAGERCRRGPLVERGRVPVRGVSDRFGRGVSGIGAHRRPTGPRIRPSRSADPASDRRPPGRTGGADRARPVCPRPGGRLRGHVARPRRIASPCPDRGGCHDDPPPRSRFHERHLRRRRGGGTGRRCTEHRNPDPNRGHDLRARRSDRGTSRLHRRTRRHETYRAVAPAAPTRGRGRDRVAGGAAVQPASRHSVGHCAAAGRRRWPHRLGVARAAVPALRIALAGDDAVEFDRRPAPLEAFAPTGRRRPRAASRRCRTRHCRWTEGRDQRSTARRPGPSRDRAHLRAARQPAVGTTHNRSGFPAPARRNGRFGVDAAHPHRHPNGTGGACARRPGLRRPTRRPGRGDRTLPCDRRHRSLAVVSDRSAALTGRRVDHAVADRQRGRAVALDPLASALLRRRSRPRHRDDDGRGTHGTARAAAALPSRAGQLGRFVADRRHRLGPRARRTARPRRTTRRRQPGWHHRPVHRRARVPRCPPPAAPRFGSAEKPERVARCATRSVPPRRMWSSTTWP